MKAEWRPQVGMEEMVCFTPPFLSHTNTHTSTPPPPLPALPRAKAFDTPVACCIATPCPDAVTGGALAGGVMVHRVALV